MTIPKRPFSTLILTLTAIVAALGWHFKDRFQPVEVGSAVPDIRAVDLENNAVSLADLRGEVVLVNVWATWCPPCREEMPSMERLHRELGPEGLRVIAISVDAASPPGSRRPDFRRVAAYVHEAGLTFPVWLDPAAQSQRLLRATAVPESFVVDRSGTIVSKVIGPEEWDSDARRALFTRLLAEGNRPAPPVRQPGG